MLVPPAFVSYSTKQPKLGDKLGGGGGGGGGTSLAGTKLSFSAKDA